MSLCRLMVIDYVKGIGRYCNCTGKELYSDNDLRFGISYSQGLLEEGYVENPVLHFNLCGFIAWAKKQLSNRKDNDTAET